MQLIEVTDQAAWDAYVSKSPFGHPLQLWGWGEAKRSNGWAPHRLALVESEKWLAAGEVLLWPIPRAGRFVAYVPRGPVADPAGNELAELLNQIVAWAKEHKVLHIRIDPAWRENDLRSSRIAASNSALRSHRAPEHGSLAVLNSPGTASISVGRNVGLLPAGWQHSAHNIQLPETYTIDLAKSEEDLLEPMSRKHRQYIRKSQRDGVMVERVTDSKNLKPMLEMYAETAQRAGFGIHLGEYYQDLLGQLGEHNYLYYAKFEGKPVAFLWLAAAGETAYELYGGVTAAGQELKANYFLKWHAMMEMKQAGYRIYDFNGRLNEGVSQFKQGFGPDETDYVGTWDYPLNKLGYKAWERLWPMAKIAGRRLAKLRQR